jgi:hypothetical protein
MLGVPEISRLFDDITKAASKKAEPIICNVVLMNAGRHTKVSMALALALPYQLCYRPAVPSSQLIPHPLDR